MSEQRLPEHLQRVKDNWPANPPQQPPNTPGAPQ